MANQQKLERTSGDRVFERVTWHMISNYLQDSLSIDVCQLMHDQCWSIVNIKNPCDYTIRRGWIHKHLAQETIFAPQASCIEPAELQSFEQNSCFFGLPTGYALFVQDTHYKRADRANWTQLISLNNSHMIFSYIFCISLLFFSVCQFPLSTPHAKSAASAVFCALGYTVQIRTSNFWFFPMQDWLENLVATTTN